VEGQQQPGELPVTLNAMFSFTGSRRLRYRQNRISILRITVRLLKGQILLVILSSNGKDRYSKFLVK
jgi:hypothetical protein